MMFHRARSFALALAAPLILWGCVITPGKFVSTLTIDADRSFAFTYVGEVYALDLGKEFAKGIGDAAKDDDEDDDSDAGEGQTEGAALMRRIAYQAADKGSGKTNAKDKAGDDFADLAKGGDEDPADPADSEKKNRAIAEALSKEAGYRKVEYLGGGRFQIDYAISGKLTYPFIYPFNVDAEAVFPFIAIELRGADRIRVKAPAFAAQAAREKISGTDASDKLDGVFTLTTDAEVVSQNNEDGATTSGGRKVIVWKATPTTKDAPMAVLKLAPLAP